ncbi:hypothetical protein BKA57DRAFT_519568, partial [Linnemannia elongata]
SFPFCPSRSFSLRFAYVSFPAFLSTFVPPPSNLILNPTATHSKTMKRTTTRSPQRISLCTFLITLALLITLFIIPTHAQGEGEYSSSSSYSSDDYPAPASLLETQQQPSPPSTDIQLSPTSSDAASTPSPITLPSVLYIPPVSFNINNDALEPIFPSGSESCQKCKYFYPKLKECNQIANQTLALLPRLVPTGNDTTTLVYPNSTTTTTTTTTTNGTDVTGSTPTGPPSTFTTLMPFLQCICPNQGLAATKVCLTCFRVSNQRNFLDQLVLQNVSTSLSAFQEACLDSNDGTVVPPAGTKGQSASSARKNVVLSSWTEGFWMMIVLSVVVISLSSSISPI